jgi:Fe-S oxidoreductase
MKNEKLYFNPGCALNIHKPEKEKQILDYLQNNYSSTQLHSICCHFDPKVPEGSCIINICAGCDRRFRSLYEGVSTISLWEVIDELDNFPFPDYKGETMTLHDACPVRERPAVHEAVRNLLKKMNIDLVETEFNGTKSVCCGDSFYGEIPIEKVHERMKARADSMPCENVVVYCVSCIKAMDAGGKKPRHLVDLLFGEETIPQTVDVIEWHNQVNAYIDAHQG